MPQPQYTVTLWNPEEDEWRLFRARFTLNGKHVVGSGSTPKKAEHAAARKYLNNNFMSGEISLQAEINIPSVQLYIVYVTDVTDVGTWNNLISISE